MHTYIHMSLQVLCLSSQMFLFGEFFLGGFCLEDFVRDGFLSIPFLSEYIRYNRKLNITLDFRFHMYEKFLKSVTSQALGPRCMLLDLFIHSFIHSPVTNCHTFLDLSPRV